MMVFGLASTSRVLRVAVDPINQRSCVDSGSRIGATVGGGGREGERERERERERGGGGGEREGGRGRERRRKGIK